MTAGIQNDSESTGLTDTCKSLRVQVPAVQLHSSYPHAVPVSDLRACGYGCGDRDMQLQVRVSSYRLVLACCPAPTPGRDWHFPQVQNLKVGAPQVYADHHGPGARAAAAVEVRIVHGLPVRFRPPAAGAPAGAPRAGPTGSPT